MPSQLHSNPPHSEKRTDHQSDNRDLTQVHQEDSVLTDGAQQRLKYQDQSVKLHHETVNQQQNEHQMPPSSQPVQKPLSLQLPASSSSLQDKRKSLTLSLTPLGVSPAPSAEAVLTTNRETEDKLSRDSTQEPHREHSAPHRRGKEQGLLSPFSFSLNKLLDWGERLLLGGLFVSPVRMGQPALPYRC